MTFNTRRVDRQNLPVLRVIEEVPLMQRVLALEQRLREIQAEVDAMPANPFHHKKRRRCLGCQECNEPDMKN